MVEDETVNVGETLSLQRGFLRTRNFTQVVLSVRRNHPNTAVISGHIYFYFFLKNLKVRFFFLTKNGRSDGISLGLDGLNDG